MEIYLGILILIIVIIIIMYNRLIKLNLRCQNALASIDNQLKRRADLIPNLVSVTKGYAEYESKTLIEVINKRNESVIDKANNDKEIHDNLTKLFALSEDYPDLKANEIFKKLQIELTGTEDKIAYARQFYNDSVQYFNSAIMTFPNNLLANIMKYKEKEYFKATEEEKKVVKVSL
ncbi:MAG: LemA family protein [Bacilli bacterium]|nr:LemA family protein [Bacilli bacterium]